MEDRGDSDILLQEALAIRRNVFDQVPGAKILDARAKLELACEQNNPYAMHVKARALELGGFGYERQCKKVYQSVYEIAEGLGCPKWTCVLNKFYITLDDEQMLCMYIWQKYIQKHIPVVKCAAEKDRLLLFTAAQNGHSNSASMLRQLYSNYYTIYEQMTFCIIQRADILVLLKKHRHDARLWYVAGKFFDSAISREFPACSGSTNDDYRLKYHAKDVLRLVNDKCRKSVLAWMSTKVLMKDMMKLIGQLIWNNREIDANKWHKDEEG